MRFSRARYVTLCQQSLVTAAVLAVGVSAASVKTLDIVPQPGAFKGAQQVAPQQLTQDPLTKRVQTPPGENRQLQDPPAETEVNTAPVIPKVREVRVTGISAEAAGDRRSMSPKTPAAPSATPAPEKQAAAKTPKKASTAKKLVALSDPQPVRGYATVGVTWKHGVQLDEDNVAVQVRTQENGTWSQWVDAAYHDEHGPDGSSTEAAADKERPGTDALVIGDVDQVQMRAETTDGTVPADLKLVVIAPGKGTTIKEAPAIDTSQLAPSAEARVESTPEASGTGAERDTVALSAMKVAAKPYIYSRAQWGANERLRDQSAPAMGTVKAGFVHHTVNANSYTSAQVPALLRGIYAYHTQSRGWRDIGYNFLVDRFGRIWEGRYGGVERAVVGAHTSGYNEVAFAMSAIGNFDIANPPAAVSTAFAKLFAWKLSKYGIRADASRVYVKNRYMQAISGHRDAGSTACPGRYLYAKLPAIRTATQRLQNAAQTGTPAPTTPAPPPSGPPYTGTNRADPKCTTASISKRAYRLTGAKTQVHLIVPLQCLLKQQSFYRYAVTGTWNGQTLAAIRAFQARVGHPVQSQVTRRDWISLLSAGSTGARLQRRARGADVVHLQRALNAALGRKLSVTGVYGSRTGRAVGLYQRRVGIRVTKVVARPTWRALRAGRW